MKTDQMNSRFTDQVVVVTGAASGIGAIIARHFADAGARLVLSDVNEQPLKAVAENIAANGPDMPTIVAGDLSKEGIAGGLIKSAVETYGTLDVLVEKAGGGIIKPILQHTPGTPRTPHDPQLWAPPWGTW